jgi:hypothetical protein
MGFAVLWIRSVKDVLSRIRIPKFVISDLDS